MDLGGFRRKMTCKNCEHINAVKRLTVTVVRCRTTVFFKRYGNFILMPTVYLLLFRILMPTVYLLLFRISYYL